MLREKNEISFSHGDLRLSEKSKVQNSMQKIVFTHIHICFICKYKHNICRKSTQQYFTSIPNKNSQQTRNIRDSTKPDKNISTKNLVLTSYLMVKD